MIETKLVSVTDTVANTIKHYLKISRQNAKYFGSEADMRQIDGLISIIDRQLKK